MFRLSYAPTQAAAAATLRLPYGYVDSAGVSQSGSITLNYRALAANAAVVTATPNPVPGIASQQSTVTIDFTTNDGTIASELSASYALPGAWSSDVANFTCASFGSGAPCRLTLRYAPIQPTPQSSFKIGYSYIDSAARAQSDAILISYAAVAPNTARVSIDSANQPSPALIAVDPGDSQDVSFTFTSSDGNALSNLRLAQDFRLPKGWASDAPLSSFSCASVTQDGKCRLVLHFKPPADQILPRQIFFLRYTYQDDAGRSLDSVASFHYTSTIYRLYAGNTDFGPSFKQCWLKMASGSGKYDLDACENLSLEFPIQSMLISSSTAYLLDNAASVIQICGVGADGALLDCVGQIKTPANAQSIALLGNAIFLRNGSDINANLYACPLSGGGGCSTIKVVSKDVAVGSVAGVTSYGNALYLLDNSQPQGRVFKCTPDLATSDITCESLQTNAQEPIQAMAAGQIGDSIYLFLGKNSATGPEFSKCSVNNGACSQFQPAAVFPVGRNHLPLTLAGMKFANNSASDTALYLLMADAPDNTRGVVRCALATAKTATSDMGDILSCAAYTPFTFTTDTQPTVIEVR